MLRIEWLTSAKFVADLIWPIFLSLQAIKQSGRIFWPTVQQLQYIGNEKKTFEMLKRCD